MSHQRHPSQDVFKEPHPISLKVLRLSRPSLVLQHPILAPLSPTPPPSIAPASVAYNSETTDTNTDPFLLSPILNLPPSFSSAYVGETFSCTLCINHDALLNLPPGSALAGDGSGVKRKHAVVRDVRVEAEMKTPSETATVMLPLIPTTGSSSIIGDGAVVDLNPGETLQKIVRFDLTEEGNHVLAVTVSYYEATETSGRSRTFRKLYQFICKASLIVRTKVGWLEPIVRRDPNEVEATTVYRRWVLEAQLENCGEDIIQLDGAVLDLEDDLRYEECNSDTTKPSNSITNATSRGYPKRVLHPGEVEQICFLLEETGSGLREQANSRLVFGVLGVGWRGEMGNRGYLTTGKLGTRPAPVQ